MPRRWYHGRKTMIPYNMRQTRFGTWHELKHQTLTNQTPGILHGTLHGRKQAVLLAIIMDGMEASLFQERQQEMQHVMQPSMQQDMPRLNLSRKNLAEPIRSSM